MRGVSVETFLEYVRTSNLEAIEAALQQSAYDIDTQDDVSTVYFTVRPQQRRRQSLASRGRPKIV